MRDLVSRGIVEFLNVPVQEIVPCTRFSIMESPTVVHNPNGNTLAGAFRPVY